MNTKEKQNFNIVLASSNSFFNLWVEQFIGPSRYTTFVLGHLDEKESEKESENPNRESEKESKNPNYVKYSECVVEASF